MNVCLAPDSASTVYQIKRSMNRSLAPLLAAVICVISFIPYAAHAQQSYVIEPDDYSEGAVLNDVHPQVDLRIYDGVLYESYPEQFGVHPFPDVIPVTATTSEDFFGGHYTSTGTKVFGHAEIDFSSAGRQLGMRFSNATGSVSIDIIGSSDLSSVVGVLEVFDVAGNLLEATSSGQLGRQDFATMSITRPTFDIGYARAYSSPDFSPFGRLDFLRFTSLAAATLEGDFNGDGSVDAADYSVWRDGLGDTYQPVDYQVWRENFGKSANSVVQVPKPGSVLVVFAVCLMWCERTCKNRFGSR